MRLLVLSLVLTAASASAQTWEVGWWTVDDGGVTFGAGGVFEVGATIGQPDAGGPMAGAPFAVQGGFWALAPQADLSITETDGQASAVPGQTLTYTIVARNAGPEAALGAPVTDAPPAALLGVTWTCAASRGSSCPASGSGAIDTSVGLIVGGTATFSLTGTVSPSATGTLANTAAATAPAGFADPDPVNNSATDTDALTAVADLGVSLADSPDPVGQGHPLTYTLSVTNTGPSASSGATLVQTLPPEVTFVSSTPPGCVPGAGVLTCALSALDPGTSATVTEVVTVGAGALGTIVSGVSVTGNQPDPAAGNDADSEATSVIAATEGELAHGTRLVADLQALPGPTADEDRYRFAQRAYSSYEVVLDGTSGDLGTGSGPALERLASDGIAVVQSSAPAGVGGSRSLRWENGGTPVLDQALRVRSQGCGADCGPEDVYRLRAYETTCTVARFNNTGTQTTVLLIQNTRDSAVVGHAYFINPVGTLLETVPFNLAPHGSFVVSTLVLPALAGQSGSIRVTHDGRYGDLVGKAVALEPATAFTFDTPLVPRPR